jgi:hypothetical protein
MPARRLTSLHLAALIVALAPGAFAAAATAAPATAVPPLLATARLQGAFELAGRVTVADNVLGEHVGENVDRIWTFTSNCPSGPCAVVGLVRQRAHASDILVLQQSGPGRYSGNGSFVAPLRCAGRVYPGGQQVPFTITVQITSAAVFGAAAIATRVDATYVNRTRINSTRCVAALGHDAVRYHGHVILSTPASARARSTGPL